jgi:hypothetical protein
MNITRLDPPSVEVPAPRRGPVAAWCGFWFTPAAPTALHAVRVLGGLLFLAWLLPLAGHLEGLFGLNGWFDAQAYREAARLREAPPNLFSWSALYLCGTSPTLLMVFYGLALTAIALFTLGLWPRLTGVLTWVAVVSFTANPLTAYDADPFLRLLAFYLMVGYLFLGQRRPGLSLYERLLGPRDARLFRRDTQGAARSVAANLAVRLLQVHVAIAILACGLHKLQIKEWWAGVAPWFYLHPPFRTSLQDAESYRPSGETYLVIYSLISYAVLAWQLAFPAFAWRPGWRPALFAGAAFAFLAGLLFLSLPLFGPLMVVLCLGYLTPAEWRSLHAFVRARLPRRRPAMAGAPEPAAQSRKNKIKGPHSFPAAVTTGPRT